MLQLKNQILHDKTRYTRAILGLDLEKAFDNVPHESILKQMSNSNLEERAYNYVRDFLNDRKATLTVGDLECEERTQGSAVMLGNPSKLREIEEIHHAIYADDITLWVEPGSDGRIENALQTAIHKVEEYLQGTGLKCSASKSKLLLYRPTRRGMPPKSYTGPREYAEIGLYTQDGNAIPKINKIKILGMIIEANGANGETMRKVEGKVTSATTLTK
ncbi:uncharacterized protein [Dermacentor albipictus]|uniref:uncharacterized protein n=1 Tax=Dermacentor albipictus TaxID=60249 RepID=UPI0038FBF628